MRVQVKKCITAVVAAFIVTALPYTQVLAASNQIDGRIYYDQNNNGVQDGAEPGVPNVLVSFGYGAGQKTDLTDASGDYAITGTTGTARVTVHSGWFRSDCNTMNCAVGTPGGNDFTTNNQWITLGSVNGTAGATLNTGLVPDWGGTYPIPASPTTVPTDVAARLTYISGCSVADKLCQPGDTAKVFLSFFNQGTSAINDPRFVVDLPVGHVLDESTSWFNPTDVYNVFYPGANTVSTLESFNSAKGTGVYQLNGTIPAGAIASVALNVNVTSAAIDSPTPYATYDPYDKQPFVSILGIDETGDQDSSFCERDGTTWRTGDCPITHQGVHNKTLGLDHTDVTGWSIDNATAYTARAYDLALQVQLATGQASTAMANTPVDYRLRITNQSAGESGVRNVKVVGYVPSGLTFSAADNPGWVLESGKPVTYLTAQILPGQSEDVPLKLRTASTAVVADNGTDALKFQAEIASQQQITASSSGNYLTATDVDSTPDSDATNDGTAIDDEITGTQGGSPNDQDDADYQAIQIVDREFVLNKSVETNQTGWTDLWNPTYTTLSRVMGDAHDGSYAIRADSSSATSVQGGFTNYTLANRWVTNTDNAKTYTASAWVKGGGTVGMNICVRLTEYNGATNLGATETCSTAYNNNWRQITHSKTATGAGHSLTMAVYSYNLRNDRYLLADDFSLTAPN